MIYLDKITFTGSSIHGSSVTPSPLTETLEASALRVFTNRTCNEEDQLYMQQTPGAIPAQKRSLKRC